MYCDRLHAWGSIQSRFTSLLSSLITRRWVGISDYESSDLKTSVSERVMAWIFFFVQPRRPLGFNCWISFTLVFLSLLYLLFISGFVCTRRWCEPNMYVSWAISELRVQLVPLNMFKPSSIFSDHSDASFVNYFCYLCFTFCSAVGNVSNCRYVSDCRSRGCEFDPSLVPYFRWDWSWNNSTAILLPSADSRRVVFSYKRKYVHKVLVNCLVKPAQQKSVARWINNQTWPKLLTWT